MLGLDGRSVHLGLLQLSGAGSHRTRRQVFRRHTRLVGIAMVLESIAIVSKYTHTVTSASMWPRRAPSESVSSDPTADSQSTPAPGPASALA